MTEDKLKHVIFISLPETDFPGREILSLDPSILLPADTSPLTPEEWSLADLSWEAIEAGLLKVLAWDPERDEIPYYKRLLLQLRPGIRDELLTMAITKSRNKDFALAKELFLCLKTLDPRASSVYLNLAVFYEAYGRHCESLNREDEATEYMDNAKKAFDKALSSPPVPAEAYYMAGLFYYSQGEYEYSHSLLNSFLDLAPSDDNRRQKAEEASQKILNLKQEKNIYLEAFRDIEQDKNQKGIDKARQFIKLNPKSWNGWFLLGWGYRKEKCWKEALEAFSHAESIQNESADLLNEMAICHMELTHFEKSRMLLEKARKLQPQDPRILSNLAILALKNDRIDEAKALFLEILDYQPEDPLAISYLEYIQKLS